MIAADGNGFAEIEGRVHDEGFVNTKVRKWKGMSFKL
jgi:hypothetical protein